MHGATTMHVHIVSLILRFWSDLADIDRLLILTEHVSLVI